MLMELLY